MSIVAHKKPPLSETHPELAKQWSSRNGLRADEITHGSEKKVWWVGDCGHEWESTVYHRTISNTGCSICAGKKILVGFNDLAYLCPWLVPEWSDKNITKPTEVTCNSNKKVKWVCNKGHEWEAAVSDRTRRKSTNCPTCAGKIILYGFNDLRTTNPDLVTQWSSSNAISPEQVSAGSSKKVWWKCAEGHEWEAVIASRNNGNGCPYCSGRKPIRGVNDLAILKPELISEWSQRNTSSPQEFTVNSSKKVWWVCVEGHEWEAVISSRVNGCGCPICSNKQALPGFNDLACLYPHLSTEWSNKNVNNPDEVTPGSEKKVWWIGSCGHEWEAIINSRVRGNGCPVCDNKKVLIGFNDLQHTNPDLASQWSETNRLSPTDVVGGSNMRVSWECEKGHVWESTISNRSRGYGCPVCFTNSYVSKIETALIKKLQVHVDIFPQHEIKYLNGKKRVLVDGFFEYNKHKYVIEYDGSYWHSTTLAKDIFKTNILLKEGYSVIRVRENDLPFLPLESDNLLQIRFNYTADHKHLPYLVDQIINYVTSPGIHSRS